MKKLADKNENRNCCNDPNCPVWGEEYLDEGEGASE